MPEMRGAAPWSRPMVKAPGIFEYADGLAMAMLLEFRWRDGIAKAYAGGALLGVVGCC